MKPSSMFPQKIMSILRGKREETVDLSILKQFEETAESPEAHEEWLNGPGKGLPRSKEQQALISHVEEATQGWGVQNGEQK